jgi:Mrp family chromosome partitioning ATPase
MKFLRAEEGDQPTPSTIRPFIQIVPALPPATNGHKHNGAHAAAVKEVPAREVPAREVVTEDAPDDDARSEDSNDIRPKDDKHNVEAHSVDKDTKGKDNRTNGAPVNRAPTHAAPTGIPVNGSHLNGTASQRKPAHMAPPPPTALPAPVPAPVATPKPQLREVNSVRPTMPRVRPEMLDACVVALRRMGGASLQSVGVTSSVRGEGRSTVAAAMAVIHASEYRRRTILVELDGHRPPAARAFGLVDGPGVAEFIRDGVDVDDCIQWVTEDFGVVVAGSDPSVASLLHGSTAEDIVEALSLRADTLVLDLPPLEKGAGGVQLVDLCEAVALVVRAGVSTHRIEEAAGSLTTPPFVILNGVKSAAPRWVRRLLGMR